MILKSRQCTEHYVSKKIRNIVTVYKKSELQNATALKRVKPAGTTS